MKPFRGNLCFKERCYFDPSLIRDVQHLGYSVIGRRMDGRLMITSAVVKYDQETGEIETLNSRYKLLGGG